MKPNNIFKMKYIYKEKQFEIGHYIFRWVGNFVHIFAELLKILTLNLVWFDFELKWTIYSLKNADKLTKYLNNIFKFKK